MHYPPTSHACPPSLNPMLHLQIFRHETCIFVGPTYLSIGASPAACHILQSACPLNLDSRMMFRRLTLTEDGGRSCEAKGRGWNKLCCRSQHLSAEQRTGVPSTVISALKTIEDESTKELT
ncbi:hypothetical protein BDN70DRAFT_880300 [Pholiota conissans]|uniref:Uncharacterized protein n=1 Tax=Pholiota conissans TaxID=109636 RepID=A0A9P6CZA6_9AGAR|nr:hypothetical protein BDN70DRAFT_880300 [Pholiota conissans]